MNAAAWNQRRLFQNHERVKSETRPAAEMGPVAVSTSNIDYEERRSLNAAAKAAIARACVTIAETLAAEPAKSDVHHFSGAPDTSWADFARVIMTQAGLSCRIENIPTAAYPTPAPRPLNSRLDCRSIEEAFGVARPDWRDGLARVLTEVVSDPERAGAYGEAGRARARQDFSWASIAAQTEALYTELRATGRWMRHKSLCPGWPSERPMASR